MRSFKILACPCILLFGLTLSSKTFAQGTCSCALEYAIPHLKTALPDLTHLPREIQTDYHSLDQTLRQLPYESKVGYLLEHIELNDSAKFIAKILYRIDDADPITFYQWGGASPIPYPYKAQPGRLRMIFEDRFRTIANDSGKAAFLLNCDFILHVKILDTLVTNYSNDNITPKMIVVKCQIQDAIKGKYVPAWAEIPPENRLGKTSGQTPILCTPTHATRGTCTQFEYAPNWSRGIQDDAPTLLRLRDSSGDWIRRDSEYIVFLSFRAITSDSSNGYYALFPNWGVFGTSGGMYPIRNGRVFDPNDDFNVSAALSQGLTPTEWKASLRKRISVLAHP